MAWDFSTDPDFEETLRWVRHFVDDVIIPMELISGGLDQQQLDRLDLPRTRREVQRGIAAPRVPRGARVLLRFLQPEA